MNELFSSYMYIYIYVQLYVITHGHSNLLAQATEIMKTVGIFETVLKQISPLAKTCFKDLQRLSAKLSKMFGSPLSIWMCSDLKRPAEASCPSHIKNACTARSSRPDDD